MSRHTFFVACEVLVFVYPTDNTRETQGQSQGGPQLAREPEVRFVGMHDYCQPSCSAWLAALSDHLPADSSVARQPASVPEQPELRTASATMSHLP